MELFQHEEQIKNRVEIVGKPCSGGDPFTDYRLGGSTLTFRITGVEDELESTSRLKSVPAEPFHLIIPPEFPESSEKPLSMPLHIPPEFPGETVPLHQLESTPWLKPLPAEPFHLIIPPEFPNSVEKQLSKPLSIPSEFSEKMPQSVI